VSFLFTSNLVPATTAAGFFALKQLLKLAGWTVIASSDGTAYSGNSDVITTGSGGAGGMANTRAWFAIRSPMTAGSFAMQRGASNDAWRIKYSPIGTFAGGGATTMPAAVDELCFRGGGTDAAPTFETQILGTTEGGQRMHMGAGDASEGAPFYLVSLNNGTNTIAGAFVRDVMLTPYASAPDDPDPSIVYFGNKTSTILAAHMLAYGNAYAMLGAGAPRSVIAGTAGTSLVQVLPGGCSAGTRLSQRSALILWARGPSQTSPRVKGWGSMLKWEGVAPAVNGDLDVNGRVMWGGVSLPWPVGLARPVA
jgi:hypothetical protein